MISYLYGMKKKRNITIEEMRETLMEGNYESDRFIKMSDEKIRYHYKCLSNECKVNDTTIEVITSLMVEEKILRDALKRDYKRQNGTEVDDIKFSRDKIYIKSGDNYSTVEYHDPYILPLIPNLLKYHTDTKK